MHLGMSGRFSIDAAGSSKGGSGGEQPPDPKHDHVVFELDGDQPARITYNDTRRFGFMDLVTTERLEECRHFKKMGPEPLSNQFSAPVFNEMIKNRSGPAKTVLLDQQVVAGLGNIYVCEALFRARISPRRRAASIYGVRGERLHQAIVAVLQDAILAGGSSLKDFANAEGELGYFQHKFDVYGREGEPCRICGSKVSRIVQGGRSTFYCGNCQR